MEVLCTMKVPEKTSPDVVQSKQEVVEKLIHEVADDPQMCLGLLNMVRDYVDARITEGNFDKALEYLDDQEKDLRAFSEARRSQSTRKKVQLAVVGVGSSVITAVVSATVTKLF